MRLQFFFAFSAAAIAAAVACGSGSTGASLDGGSNLVDAAALFGDGAVESDGGAGGDCAPGTPLVTYAVYVGGSRCGDRIGVDPAYVYWIGGMSAVTITRSDKAKGGSPAFLASAASNTFCDFVVSGSEVFYTTLDEVKRSPSTPTDTVSSEYGDAGPDAAADAGAIAAAAYGNIAVDADTVYWTAGTGANATVKAAPRAGGAWRQLVTPPLLLGAIALDADYVYGLAPGAVQDAAACAASRVCNYPNGAVVRIPKAGGAAQPVYSNIPNLAASPSRSLVVDGKDLYFVRAATVDATGKGDLTGAVVHGTVDGAPLVTLATQLNSPSGPAVDGAFVYYSSGTQLFKVPKIGGTPTYLTEGYGPLAVDERAIYHFGRGSVPANSVFSACK